MQINIKNLLEKCGLDEKFYPGKRLVKKLPQSGEHKSHNAVFDWTTPALMRIDIKAGLSGKNLEPKELRKYPVSFQSPTYIEIDTSAAINNNDRHEDDDEEEEEGSRGKGGSGKAPKTKRKQQSLNAFSRVMEGKIPEKGDIKKLVVMGKEIAKEAFESVLNILADQIKSLCVTPVNIIAAARAIKVSVAEPGGGLRAKGHETTSYRYQGAEMFGLENVPSPKP